MVETAIPRASPVVETAVMSLLPLHLGALSPFGRLTGIGRFGRHDLPRMDLARGGRAAAGAVSAETAGRDARKSMAERTDENLLQDYLDGDREAFKELLGRYSQELVHFLTRFLGSRAAAEDVFQETFLQVHQSAETFDTSRRFKPWLFTIAANKARDYHRKHNRRRTMSLSAQVSDDEDGQQFVDLMEADLPSPDAPVLDAERSRLVKQVVDEMPSHLREILLLSYFQKMSYQQIAEVLEIPLGTVKSRLHTAVATFASAWKAARQQDRVHDSRERGGDEFNE